MSKPDVEAPYVETDADRRYSDLMDRVIDWDRDFAYDLDAAVGVRLCEHEDRGEDRAERAGAVLALEVLRLRRDLDELRTQLATEVRSRRLVLVNDRGQEIVIAEADYVGTHGPSVVVRDPHNRHAAVLYANTDGSPDAGVCVTVDGDIAAQLNALGHFDGPGAGDLGCGVTLHGFDAETKTKTTVELSARHTAAEVYVASGVARLEDSADQARVTLYAQHLEDEQPSARVIGSVLGEDRDAVLEP